MTFINCQVTHVTYQYCLYLHSGNRCDILMYTEGLHSYKQTFSFDIVFHFNHTLATALPTPPPPLPLRYTFF